MTFHSARFGEIEFADHDVVTLETGPLGYEADTRFLLLQHGDAGPFRWMQSLCTPELAFLVVDPATYFADYAPALEEAAAFALELEEATPRLVYTIVTIPKGKPEEMTLNLAGPIVINAITRVARQVIVEDESWRVRQRVFEPSEADQPIAA